jgi:hypothetical protein
MQHSEGFKSPALNPAATMKPAVGRYVKGLALLREELVKSGEVDSVAIASTESVLFALQTELEAKQEAQRKAQAAQQGRKRDRETLQGGGGASCAARGRDAGSGCSRQRCPCTAQRGWYATSAGCRAHYRSHNGHPSRVLGHFAPSTVFSPIEVSLTVKLTLRTPFREFTNLSFPNHPNTTVEHTVKAKAQEH